MFDELSKYKQTNHFFFKVTDNLIKVCNAPTDKSGVYIIYALKGGQIELIYIGCSGKIKSDGTLFIPPLAQKCSTEKCGGVSVPSLSLCLDNVPAGFSPADTLLHKKQP